MMRVGQGWDLHRLVDGRPLRLGGLTVPFDRGLLGHSDGDAVLHAVCDALLGAIGAGDMGTHFSDRDPRWKGSDSAVFLARVVALLGERGYVIGNVDVTIIADCVRLEAHLPAMRERLAALLALDADRVSVKAKTHEGLGAIGHGEAIAALAVALVRRGAPSERD